MRTPATGHLPYDPLFSQYALRRDPVWLRGLDRTLSGAALSLHSREGLVGQAILLVDPQRQSKTAAAEHTARGVSCLGEGGDEGEFGQFSIDRP